MPPAANRPTKPKPKAETGLLRTLIDTALLPVTVTRQALPKHELPVYLGMAAAAAIGVIEWPVAAAAGLGYAALRRWRPSQITAPATGPEPTE